MRRREEKFSNKKKNGQAYYVEWDSDASSNSDDDDDDDKKISKGLAGVAIKEAPSLFSTPFCLMARSEPKVSSTLTLEDSDDDDDDDNLSYDDLVQMLNDSNEILHKNKYKLMDMKSKYLALQ